MKLLYRTAEWHALAKLRMHTDSSLDLLDEVTKEFGELMRRFQRSTCAKYATVELPREKAARKRRQTRRSLGGPKSTSAVTDLTATNEPNPECRSFF